MVLKNSGLGQLTELGADTVLLWNNTFYYQFCPLVLTQESCNLGYAQLSEDDQGCCEVLWLLLPMQNALDCPAEIDLNHAIFSIDLFAQTITANCQQVGQIVTNATGKPPGAAANFEDLWKFTLANYHAGPGCLTNAIYASSGNLTWENVFPELETDCPGTQSYVDKIAK